MRTTTLALLATTLITGGTAAALAQPGPGPGDGSSYRGKREVIFNRMDANDDGRVTTEEHWAWVQSRFRRADTNDDGAVTLDELRDMWRSRRGGDGPGPGRDGRRSERFQERTFRMFRFVDANLDGRVILEEVRPMAAGMFRAADENVDGLLTRNEMRWHHHGPRDGRGGPPAYPGDTPRR